MSDLTLEQEIQAKGLTAPRITPQDIKDVVVREYYFTGLEGVRGHEMLGEHEECIVEESVKTHTFCILVLENGAVVTGESNCVSPENFDAEVGRRVARENAEDKIWALEGYLLRQRLFEKQ